ncbi:60S ribosomal export protein NMD3 [Trichinella patagoniensis]|uniref:60S ribosomal export protein NMD3 n=1 Tax=Trichinella patagoniensis TaxID=990121 RepID=A0A0V0ZB92_9BILA|nr:60S ribosomal export protein NMD3 [Trichinella patagoniensis]
MVIILINSVFRAIRPTKCIECSEYFRMQYKKLLILRSCSILRTTSNETPLTERWYDWSPIACCSVAIVLQRKFVCKNNQENKKNKTERNLYRSSVHYSWKISSLSTVVVVIEMQYSDQFTGSSPVQILCCQCGTLINPNPANKCVACIRTTVDITECIPRQCQLYSCKFCNRYLNPPSTWVHAELESKELLRICLKKIPVLKQVRLVDAKFIWTEPHSKRIKVMLTIQKEVLGGVILQQSVVVEYVIHNQMCDACQKIEAKDYWRACVQIRQKSTHKKSLYYLEQLILKYKLNENISFVKQVNGGMDFFYSKNQHAWKLVQFIGSVLASQYGTSKELVTHDASSNIYDYKRTYSVEIVPVCKDDIVCLSKNLAQSLGNFSQVLICYRTSKFIHLVEPHTGRGVCEVSPNVYWRSPFYSIAQHVDFFEYTVLDVEWINVEDCLRYANGETANDKYLAVEALVVRSSELGRLDAKQYYCRTHLGYVLKAGDTVLGFDTVGCNVNNDNFNSLNRDDVADVILVRKIFDRTRRNRRRLWKLKRLEAELMETDSLDNDYTGFLEDLEEDSILREKVNIYRDPTKQHIPVAEDEFDDDLPAVDLQEMLSDLCINDQEMDDAR